MDNARAAVAAPVAILAAMLCMAFGAALSNVAEWPLYVAVAILPLALGLWLSRVRHVVTRVALAFATLVLGLGLVAAVLTLLVPLFEVEGVGISGTGVYAMIWGPPVVLLLGSLVARMRSQAPLFGAWLLWWIAVAAAIIWAEPLTYALTDLAGADAMAGTLAVLAAPLLGMSVWLAAVSVVLMYSRLTRGTQPAPAEEQALA